MTISRVIVIPSGPDKWQECVFVEKKEVPGNVLADPWHAAQDAVWRARLVVQEKQEKANG